MLKPTVSSNAPYWVCTRCKRVVARVKDGWVAAHEKHKQSCPSATYSIKSLPQATTVIAS